MMAIPRWLPCLMGMALVLAGLLAGAVLTIVIGAAIIGVSFYGTFRPSLDIVPPRRVETEEEPEQLLPINPDAHLWWMVKPRPSAKDQRFRRQHGASNPLPEVPVTAEEEIRQRYARDESPTAVVEFIVAIEEQIEHELRHRDTVWGPLTQSLDAANRRHIARDSQRAATNAVDRPHQDALRKWAEDDQEARIARSQAKLKANLGLGSVDTSTSGSAGGFPYYLDLDRLNVRHGVTGAWISRDQRRVLLKFHNQTGMKIDMTTGVAPQPTNQLFVEDSIRREEERPGSYLPGAGKHRARDAEFVKRDMHRQRVLKDRVYARQQLEKQTVEWLRKRARREGVAYTGLRKDELIEAIMKGSK